MKTLRRNVLKGVVLCCGLIPLAYTVQATEYTWVGPTSSQAGDKSWNNTANWSPSGYPNSSDDVAIFPTRIVVSLTETHTVGELRKTGGVAWENVELHGPGTLQLEGELLVRGRPFLINCDVTPADVPIHVINSTLNWNSASTMDRVTLTNSDGTTRASLNRALRFGRVDAHGPDIIITIGYNDNVSSTINLYDARLTYGLGGNAPHTFSGRMQEQSGPSTVTLLHGYKPAVFSSANDYSGVTVIRGNNTTGENGLNRGMGAVFAQSDGVFGTSDIVVEPNATALRLRAPNTDMIADTASLYLSDSELDNCFIWIEAGVVEQIAGLYVNGVRQPDGYYGSLKAAEVHPHLNVNTDLASYFPGHADWGNMECSGVLYVKTPPPAGTVIVVK